MRRENYCGIKIREKLLADVELNFGLFLNVGKYKLPKKIFVFVYFSTLRKIFFFVIYLLFLTFQISLFLTNFISLFFYFLYFIYLLFS